MSDRGHLSLRGQSGEPHAHPRLLNGGLSRLARRKAREGLADHPKEQAVVAATAKEPKETNHWSTRFKTQPAQ
jgi:hypothetical protein